MRSADGRSAAAGSLPVMIIVCAIAGTIIQFTTSMDLGTVLIGGAVAGAGVLAGVRRPGRRRVRVGRSAR